VLTVSISRAMFSPFSKNALANTTKVFKAVGLSVTDVGVHLHSLVMSHSQNLPTRVMIQGRSDRDTVGIPPVDSDLRACALAL
jgi:hypothetical protein